MKYEKTTTIQGEWIRADKLQGVKSATIISETTPQPSQFKDSKGNTKNQDVAKVIFDGLKGEYNISLNRATINGLIDAFGDDSKDWMNKDLKVETEKVRVAGKAVVAVFLIPQGFKRIDDDNGYAMIVKDSIDNDIPIIDTPTDDIDEINSEL